MVHKTVHQKGDDIDYQDVTKIDFRHKRGLPHLFKASVSNDIPCFDITYEPFGEDLTILFPYIMLS